MEGKGRASVNSPYENAGFLSRLSFSWAYRTVLIGKVKTIEQNDLSNLCKEDTSEDLTSLFYEHWEKNCDRKKYRLWRSVIAVILGVIIKMVVLGLFESFFKIGSSLCLGVVVGKLELIGSDENSPSGMFQGMGSLMYCSIFGVLLITMMFISAVCHHQLFFRSKRIGVKLVSMMTCVVYSKLLRLDGGYSRSNNIIGLISNDTETLYRGFILFHMLIIGIIEVFLVVYFLVQKIGVIATCTGLLTLISIIPLQYFMSRLIVKYQKGISKCRDDLVGVIGDSLAGVKVIKFYAWEVPFMRRVLGERRNLLKGYYKMNCIRSVNEAFAFFFSLMVSSVAFLTLYYQGLRLDASNIFSSLSLFFIIQLGLSDMMPRAIEYIARCSVSISRIEYFLSLKESRKTLKSGQDSETMHNNTGDETSVICIKNHSFYWMGNNNFELSKVDLNIKPGEIVMLMGKNGSGKSSFIYALMNELEVRDSDRQKDEDDRILSIKGTIAYSPQQSWIFYGTILENILMDRKYDEERLNVVMRICCLTDEINGMKRGIHTLISDQESSLSGGQKARICIARALYDYHKTNIYLFDDIFASIDNIVISKIIRSIIGLMRHTKSVMILSTNMTQYLQYADRVLELDDGKFVFNGSYNEFISSSSSCLEEYTREDDEGIPLFSTEEILKQDMLNTEMPIAQDVNFEERKDKGKISIWSYIYFLKIGSGPLVLLLLLVIQLVPEFLYVYSNEWISNWSSQTYEVQRNPHYANVLIVLTLFTVIFSLIRAFVSFNIIMRSSVSLFDVMVQRVFRSPIQFFQVNNIGRMLNRFSKDFIVIDEELIWLLFDTFQCFLIIVGTIGLVCFINVWLVFVIPVLTLFYYLVISVYLKSSLEIKRCEIISRSPIISLFNSTAKGLFLIRSMDVEVQESFIKRIFGLQNTHSECLFSSNSIDSWMGMILDVVNLVFLGTVFFSVVYFGSIDRGSVYYINPASIGFSLSYTMGLIGLVQWFAIQFSMLENMMTSVDRVFEYSVLPIECPNELLNISDGKAKKMRLRRIRKKYMRENTQDMEKGNGPLYNTLEEDVEPGKELILDSKWPNGVITIKNLNLNSPLNNSKILIDVNVEFFKGEKVGIIGRTGAGKSSFISSFLRLVEPYPKGCIKIDGISLSDIPIYELRKRISVIPQEPVLFSGSVRFNLDPFGDHSDQEIITAIDLVRLDISNQQDILDKDVSDISLSSGQKQLLCIARIILRKTNIIFMDEATSNMDSEMTLHISRLVQKIFKTSNVFTIAHRLQTVMDYDRIMVLDSGSLAEFDTPWNLLSKNGVFSDMINKLGKEEQERLTKMAREKHNERAN